MAGEFAHRTAGDVDLPDRRVLVVSAERSLDARKGDRFAVARPRDLGREDTAWIGRRDRPRSMRQTACRPAGCRYDPQVVGRSQRGRRIVVVAGVEEDVVCGGVGGHKGELAAIRPPRGVDHVAAHVGELTRPSSAVAYEELMRGLRSRSSKVGELRAVGGPPRNRCLAAAGYGVSAARTGIYNRQRYVISGALGVGRDQENGDALPVGRDGRLFHVDDTGHVGDLQNALRGARRRR